MASDRNRLVDGQLQARLDDALAWRTAALGEELRVAELQREVDELSRELAVTRRTVSWRATAGLRAMRRAPGTVRSLTGRVEARAGRSRSVARAARWAAARTDSRRRPVPTAPAPAVAPAGAAGGPGSFGSILGVPPPWSRLQSAFADRLAVVTALLADDPGPRPPLPLAEATLAFEGAVAVTNLAEVTVAWLAWVAQRASYPTESELDDLTNLLVLDGWQGLTTWMWQDFASQLRTGTARRDVMRVVRGGVLADVTHTASNDLHTGIQRVVRETVERWLRDRDLVLFAWDWSRGTPAQLAPGEVVRFLAWRERIKPGRESPPRSPVGQGDDVLVPWGGTLIIPELFAEPARSDRYRALARAKVVDRVSVLGYDLIPVTIGETVAPGMSPVFVEYLNVVKYVGRVSAISQSSAREFRGFTAMLAGQGLVGPEVVGHLLPAQLPPVEPKGLERAREQLGMGSGPMVLVVGSHEPRKNHLTVLVAAERLWRSGLAFELAFIGGSGWLGESFHELAGELARKHGRRITIVKRADEDTLWAAYQLARFSVFPSLAEGFGLPVAESLISGTPAITSDFGSMAEIAAAGGTLVVDPRDPGQIEAAMRKLLTDDRLLERLADEARHRPWKSWDDYAAETWQHLVGS